jgi:hypothetical protein
MQGAGSTRHRQQEDIPRPRALSCNPNAEYASAAPHRAVLRRAGGGRPGEMAELTARLRCSSSSRAGCPIARLASRYSSRGDSQDAAGARPRQAGRARARPTRGSRLRSRARASRKRVNQPLAHPRSAAGRTSGAAQLRFRVRVRLRPNPGGGRSPNRGPRRLRQEASGARVLAESRATVRWLVLEIHSGTGTRRLCAAASRGRGRLGRR